MKENGNGNKLKIVRLKTKKGIPENFAALDTVITHWIIKSIGTEGTIIVNGVPGLIEHPSFKKGTMDIFKTFKAIKSANPKIKIFGGGGNFGIAAYNILGEKGVQENFDGIFTMGGALWELISTGELSAMNFIDRKFPREKVNGIYNYVSFLKNIMDVPFSFWEGKTVNLIVDLNVDDTSDFDKLEKIELSEFQKIIGIIDSLAYLLKMGTKEIRIFSHNGRYKDYVLSKDVASGTVDPRYSLKNLAPVITILLRKTGALNENEMVEFVPDCLTKSSGKFRVSLFENTRFYREESANNPEFTQKLLTNHPAHCAINDAVASGHRGKECSKGGFVEGTEGPKIIGSLSIKELQMVSNIFFQPQRPLIAVFQGSKTDKIPAMKPLIENKIINKVIILGDIANLFWNGDKEAAMVKEAAKKSNIPLILPDEVIAAEIPKGMTKEKFVKALKANAI